MLSVTRLLCGTATPGDALRYGREAKRLPPHLLHFSADKRPVIAWNITRRCNLHCAHCYVHAQDHDFPGEMTTVEAMGVVEQLAEAGTPVILFSGGEPLVRPDILDLATRAIELGVRTVLSTNGTLIDRAIARRIKEIGFSYVGISLDGTPATHDHFRGARGAFEASLGGIRACREAGVRVGVRFTITKRNQDELPFVFDLIEREDIPRLCVYHLAYAGRGSKLQHWDLDPAETRRAVDSIFDRVLDFHRRGIEKDVLTVDNHTDAVYLYLRVLRDEPQRAAELYELLRWNGGNQSGIAIAAIDNFGNVHPDQFWQSVTVGNVRERRFGEIWYDSSNPVLAGLRNRRTRLEGRCRECRFLEICNGNLRVRAESATGNAWAADPACYLTDEEIYLTPATPSPPSGEGVAGVR